MDVALALAIAAVALSAVVGGATWLLARQVASESSRHDSAVAALGLQVDEMRAALDGQRLSVKQALAKLSREVGSSVADVRAKVINDVAELQNAVEATRDDTDRLVAELLKRHAESVRLDAMAAVAEVAISAPRKKAR